MTHNGWASIWQWSSLCGEGGFQVWSSKQRDFGICFQRLCFHIPVLLLLAISSAYYFWFCKDHVVRPKLQKVAILIRSVISLILIFTPVLQMYNNVTSSEENKENIIFFLGAVQGISWCSHFFYTLGLRKRLGKNPRGPTSICIIWSFLFALIVISVRSEYLRFSIQQDKTTKLAFGISVFYMILQCIYALTLVPGAGNTTYLHFQERDTEIPERQPLLNGSANVRSVEEHYTNYLGVALENTHWMSCLMFSWVYGLVKKGADNEIVTSEDLYDLPFSMSSDINSNKLGYYLDLENDGGNLTTVEVSTRSKTTSLFVALHKCYAWQFYSLGIIRLIADCCCFAGPILLNKLLDFIEKRSIDIKWGYTYAAGLIVSTCLATLCDSHFNFWISVVVLKMRGGIINIIYRKILSVRSTVLMSKLSVGEIMNYISTDTNRIVNSCPSFHSFWSIPFRLLVTLYLLYTEVELAFLAGVICSILLIPINKCIAKNIWQRGARMMAQKDSRFKLMLEILQSIKAIKLYVWEQHFVRLLTRHRDFELHLLKSRKYLEALSVFFWATTPVIISILTFVTYVIMGKQLTAATVFTGVALLNMLVSPLNAFPWALNGLAKSWVALKRIQKLLNLPIMNFDEIYDSSCIAEEQNQNVELLVENGTFKWEKTSHPSEIVREESNVQTTNQTGETSVQAREHVFKLVDISLKIKKGEFIGVMGSVGCGKSTLLSSILGELTKESGTLALQQVDAGVGLVTQQPWLQRGTIRDNILFGKPYEEKKYRTVMFACGLIEDMQILPAGDKTEVGDSGGTLSGGQKARITLARAVYQEKPIYLLDDIFSAVDVQVCKHIFHHCIMGLLQHKTRLLCTHHVKYLLHADWIVLMEEGSVKKIDKPVEILRNIDDTLPVDLELEESSQSSWTIPADFNLDSSLRVKNNKVDEDNELFREVSERGRLNFSVVSSYWKSIGHVIGCSILFSLTVIQFSRNMTDWWLANGVANQTDNSSTLFIGTTDNQDINSISIDVMSKFLNIYVQLACVNIFFALIRSFIVAYGGIMVAKKFHQLLLKTVLKAQCTFFDVTPIGRILNRFSSDTYTVDDSLPLILNLFLCQLFTLLGSLFITMYGLPWICVLLIPLIPIYMWLLNRYRVTSRELKRISSVTLSPIYNHFNETIQGLSIIRAMRMNQKFRHEMEEHLEANLKAQLASLAATRWLGLRLQFIGVFIITGVSFIAIIQHQYDIADTGFVGLTISYALSITGSLSGVVSSFTETERELVALERINQYIQIIPEETKCFIIDPPFSWPSQGGISFRNVTFRYRKHLNPSLKNISFDTRPHEKIGVVGRTGAGKSSIISALFRLVEIDSGVITIDTVNIATISLEVLRSRMFCIPQDPFLFSGSLRDNLDPLKLFEDDQIWNALAKVNLANVINSLGGLDYQIDVSGSNLSVGQKQLVCVARAVLRNVKILCIDEATANVDEETDRLIQNTIRAEFRTSTVITIAHRIQTILNSDRVLVVHQGEIVEFDKPEVLMADPSSHFYKLVEEDKDYC